MQHRKQQQSDWVEDRTFENDQFIVQVNKLPLRWPRYSLTVCAKGREGKITRFIPIRASGQGKVTVEPFADSIAALLIDAEDYIERELQAAEDRNIEFKQEREFRDINQGNPRPQKGIKAWGKQDKFKRDLSGETIE